MWLADTSAHDAAVFHLPIDRTVAIGSQMDLLEQPDEASQEENSAPSHIEAS